MDIWIKDLYIKFAKKPAISKMIIHKGIFTRKWRTGSVGISQIIDPHEFYIQDFINMLEKKKHDE